MVYTLIEATCGCMTVPVCLDFGVPHCKRCGELFVPVEDAVCERYETD